MERKFTAERLHAGQLIQLAAARHFIKWTFLGHSARAIVQVEACQVVIVRYLAIKATSGAWANGALPREQALVDELPAPLLLDLRSRTNSTRIYPDSFSFSCISLDFTRFPALFSFVLSVFPLSP